MGHVMGSDEACIQLRSQIWSTAIYMGPPTVWITINPLDLCDPIAQVFAGENIDLDNFLNTMGPDSSQHAKNIAGNPFAAAKIFHFLVHIILETLFGIKVTKFQIHSEMGIMGHVSAYFGTVECQGKGTLHLHLLLWLKNAPSSNEMQDMLKSEEFQAKVKNFIQANFQAYLPGLESRESVKALPRRKDISYSRPVHPHDPMYERRQGQFELELASAEQVHACKLRHCLSIDTQGQLKCKCGAPFQCAEDDFILENGEWGPK